MGNINYITDKDGNYVGTLDLGFLSFFVVQKIIKKYVPNFNLFTSIGDGTANKTLEKVYNNCTEAENIQMLLFINDKSKYSEKDLSAFDEAIKQYSEEWPDAPLEIIKTVRKWLMKHKILHQSYECTTDMLILQKTEETK